MHPNGSWLLSEYTSYEPHIVLITGVAPNGLGDPSLLILAGRSPARVSNVAEKIFGRHPNMKNLGA